MNRISIVLVPCRGTIEPTSKTPAQLFVGIPVSVFIPFDTPLKSCAFLLNLKWIVFREIDPHASFQKVTPPPRTAVETIVRRCVSNPPPTSVSFWASYIERRGKVRKSLRRSPMALDGTRWPLRGRPFRSSNLLPGLTFAKGTESVVVFF